MARSAAVTAIAALVLAASVTAGALAQAPGGERNSDQSARAAYAQANPKSRPRTRLRVSPRCFYRTEAVPFPVPYECEAPGPGYVRQCAARLVQEYRPSGTVIIPRMNCWWERG